MTMDRIKITITADDLVRPEVDERLDAQRQHRATLQHFDTAQIIVPTSDRPSWLARPWLVLGSSAALGAVVSCAIWAGLSAAGLISVEAIDLASELRAIDQALAVGRLDAATASAAREALAASSSGWSPAWWSLLSGPLVVLACIERVVDRDLQGALRRAAIVVPLAVMLVILSGWFHSDLGWALTGPVVGAMPGILDRISRRAMIGAGCGLLGGLLGGAVAWAIPDQLPGAALGSALGASFIGVTLGLAETRQKLGRLHVEQGLIAGKSFLLYRDPTLLGSAPNSHIYLFRDREVGRRHAAIRKTPGGYEIENLPLGGPTLLNDRPVARAKLRSGDRLKVGRTVLRFSEQVNA
jgi:hypothetical protein